MRRLRGVISRLPSLFDRGALDAACREIQRIVPIDYLGVGRVADDGGHLRIYTSWMSRDVLGMDWALRRETTRAQLTRTFAGGTPRICRDTRRSQSPLERVLGPAGIRATIAFPVGDPIAGVVGFGFTTVERLDRARLPLLRELAHALFERLDEALTAAHAARLRAMTAAMPMGALMMSRHGTVEEVNPAAERLLARPAAQLIGRSIRELVTAPDGGPLGWRIDEANGPAPAVLHTADGARPVVVQLAPRGAEPSLFGPLLIVEGAADRAVAAALAEREREHRALVDAMPVLVWSADRRGRCTYVSAAVERILGYTPDEIYAMESFAALNLDPVPPDYGRRPGVYEVDFRQRHKDGREVLLRHKTRVLGDESGRVVGFEGFAIDITKERDAHRQLLLADRLAALGMLVAGIGHEINNPAAYVSLGVQQIARHLRGARGQAPERLQATVERVLPILDDVAAGVHRIAEIVGELKLFARDPSEEATAPVDLNGIVRSAATLVQAELRTRARLRLDLDELPPMPGSWSRLSQVALNLIINAAQAIAPGAPDDNEVLVATRRVGDAVHLLVRDTGCGIAPEALSRVFDPFYTSKPVGEGTGLGLSISYDIARRLGGAIDVESELGRGSSFTVILPIVDAAGASEDERATLPTPSGSVLVVDDEAPLAAAIARELGARMQVELAPSGSAALDALARARFDAVLCDLRMPDLSGAEVYRRTAARDRGQAARFVFITGAAAATGEADFLRAVGRPVLEKPFAMAELWRAVGTVVGS